MDPASLSIGVIPLAINIAQVCSAVRQKRSSYKAASTDIENVLDKVDFIGQICSRLEVASSLPGHRHDTAMLERALEKCYARVCNVKDDLDKVLSTKEGRKRSFQYVLNKSHIERSLSDLNDSIFMLTNCLAASTYLGLHTLTSASTTIILPEEDQHEVRRSVSQVPEACSSPCPTQGQRGQLMKATTRTWSFRNPFFLYENVTTEFRDENDQKSSSSNSLLIGSPLIGTFISFALRYGPLSPLSLSLDAPQFIYEKHQKTLFDGIVRHAPRRGATAQDVAHWVSRFNVKPSMQLIEGNDETRYSLLGMLIACNRLEAFRYLVERGGRHLGDDQHLCCGLPWSRGGTKNRHDITKTYIEFRGPLLTLEEYAELQVPSHHPSTVIDIFDLCGDLFRGEMGELVCLTMNLLIMGFTSSRKQFEAQPWASAVTKLLSAGFNIHETVSRGLEGCTALYSIMTDEFRSPMEVLECSENWIEVLNQTEVDVDGYLYVELLIQMQYMDDGFETPEEWLTEDLEPWNNMDVRSKLEVIFDLLNPGLRVPIYVDNAHKADLLQIMPALRYGGDFPLSLWRIEEPSHLDWKMCRVTDDAAHMEDWPFLKSTKSVHCRQRGYSNLSKSTTKALESHDRFLQLINTRFERRQRRKWEKVKKRTLVEESWSKAPGGWEMDWWEYQGAW